jgi:hypothetical protein
MFILENYFESKSFAALCEAFNTVLLQEFFDKRFFIFGLLSVAFGHTDLQNLLRQTTFLLGFFKERFYSSNSQSLEELKHKTQQIVANKCTRNTSQTCTK